MNDESWEQVLPRMFAVAGIEVGSGFAVDPLTGGVSSDIVRIRMADGRDFCAKRALRKLKVASDWQAPLERNHYEVAWLRRAGAIVPGAVPKVLGEDQAAGVALLEYLPPERYRLWKSELLAGRVADGVAAAVADVLGRIHAATFDSPEIAAEFPTDHLIEALRLDPYLRFTASRHPELAEPLLAVVERTATTKRALVHGDVSPKNILIANHDRHPVLLDAECAWYGDPAFDAAFCLNHLVLKAVHMPALSGRLLDEAAIFGDRWLAHLPEALRLEFMRRTAALLPCLMLARVDGKSPVEYLSEAHRQLVRDMAMPAIQRPPASVPALLEEVRAELAAGGERA
ncbi:MAG TPA: phosphotransferase [Devosiaceae bacterium]|jgi:5-methylthioribose kinase|nr:phosphotransferase [Devosiaceae bacterium]